jgi:hypothetical protein
MRKLLLLLTFIFIFGSAVVSAQQKMTANDVVDKHLASIGPAEVIASIKSRVMVGTGKLEAKIGTSSFITGPGQLASQGDKVLYALIFNSPNYPYEKAAFDGKDISLGLPNGNRTLLTDFLKAQGVILKDGLFTGALSTAWPLLDLKSKKGAKVEYAGTAKIDDRLCHKLKYSSGRTGDLKTTLYFDAETFHHVRTTYEYTTEPRIGRSSTDTRSSSRVERYSLTEEFSNFKIAGKLTLPMTYVIKSTNEQQIVSTQGANALEWTFIVLQVYYDEPLEATMFKVS